MENKFTFFEKFIMISTKETLLFLLVLFGLFYFMYYLAQKELVLQNELYYRQQLVYF